MNKRTSTFSVAILGVMGLCIAIPLGVNVYRDVTDPLKKMARKHGITRYYEKDGYLRDQIEWDAEFRRVETEADAAAGQELEARGLSGMRIGRANVHERIKKQVLKERYGIEWRTVGEMNPWVCFD